MKALIILLFATVIVGCGDDKGEAVDVPTCVEGDGPQQIVYSDGVERKSNVQTCTYKSGRVCVYASWVSNASVTYTDCRGG